MKLSKETVEGIGLGIGTLLLGLAKSKHDAKKQEQVIDRKVKERLSQQAKIEEKKGEKEGS